MASRSSTWNPDDGLAQADWPAYVDRTLKRHQGDIGRLDGEVQRVATDVVQLRKDAVLLGDDDHRKAYAFLIAQAIRQVRRQEWRDRIKSATRNKLAVASAAVFGLGTAVSLVWTLTQVVDHFILHR